MSGKRQDWEKDLERELSDAGRELESAMRDFAGAFQSNVAPVLKNASRSFGRAVRDAALELGDAVQESTAPARARRKKEKRMKLVYLFRLIFQ